MRCAGKTHTEGPPVGGVVLTKITLDTTVCQQEVDGEVDSDVAGESVIVFDIADEVYSL